MAPPKKNDILSQLSRQTPMAKLGILVLAMFLVGGVYWQFFYKDLQAAKESENSTRNGLLANQNALNKRIDDLAKLREKRDALEAEVSGIEFALPTDPEINSFLDMLQTKAGEAGISFKNWKNEKEVDAGKYQKVPLTITVEGNFYQLMNFFFLLGPGDATDDGVDDPAKKGKFDRIVTVENLSMSEASLRNDEILLTATFTAATFRQEQPKQPAAKKGAKKGAKKSAQKGTKQRNRPGAKKPPSGAVVRPKTPSMGSGTPAGQINRIKRDTNAALDKREKYVKDSIKGATGTGGAPAKPTQPKGATGAPGANR